jgi:hypothetical protein
VIRRALRTLGLLAAVAWASVAIHYAGPPAPWRDGLAVALLAGGAAWVALARGRARLAVLVPVALVVGWWLLLPARNDRDWQPDVAVLPAAEVAGDEVVVRGVRNNEYRTEQDYTVRHEDRRYSLARLRTLDLFLSYWGSPWIAHTILSFGFDDGQQLAISIETRKERGEEYSAVAGFFRKFELIYVVADERDVVRLRTSYRGEDVYLYRLVVPPDTVRTLFLEYLAEVDGLRERPRWYNALFHNCTTAIPGYRQRAWRSWKLLANGYLDELAYEIGAVDRTLPFAELKARSHINDRARAARDAPDFSRRIRAPAP